MAIIIYNNGIVEEYIADDQYFNEEELIALYDTYDIIKSCRIPDAPECWMVWGDSFELPEIEFNTIGSRISSAAVYSHILLAHDSEINPSWNITDVNPILEYKEFLTALNVYIDNMAEELNNENIHTLEETGEELDSIFLESAGHTEDHRVLYNFDTTKQQKNFFKTESWYNFASESVNYIKKTINLDLPTIPSPFVLFADTKTIMLIERSQIEKLTNHLINYLQKYELYEDCQILKEYTDKWALNHDSLIEAKEDEKPE